MAESFGTVKKTLSCTNKKRKNKFNGGKVDSKTKKVWVLLKTEKLLSESKMLLSFK